MGVAQLLLASTLPVLKVVLLGSVGVVLARTGVLTAEGRHVLSKLNYAVFTPALTFSKLAPAITLQHLHQWLPIPLNMLLSVGVGLGLGQLVAVVTKAPPWFRPHIVAATGLGNAGNLPLVLVAALVKESHGSLPQGPHTVDLAVAYVALGIFVAVLTHFSIGKHLLQHPEADQGRLPLQQWGDPAVAGAGAAVAPGSLVGRLGALVGSKQGYSRLEPGAGSPDPHSNTGKAANGSNAIAAVGAAQQANVYVISDADRADDGVGQEGQHSQKLMQSSMVQSSEAHQHHHQHQQEQQQQQQQHQHQQQQRSHSRESDHGQHHDHEPLMGSGHSRSPSSFSVAAQELPHRWSGSDTNTWLAAAKQALVACKGAATAVLGYLSPPLLGCLVSLLVGTVPPVRDLFFGEDGALRIVQDCIDMMGQCCIPALMIMVGATLEKGPGAGKLPARVVAGVALSRLVVLPLLGTAWVMAAYVTGLISPPDPIFLIVMLLQNSVPTALNVQTMCVMWNSHSMEMSQVIFWSYLLCIITLPPFLFLYMYLGQVYFPASGS